MSLRKAVTTESGWVAENLLATSLGWTVNKDYDRTPRQIMSVIGYRLIFFIVAPMRGEL